MAGHLFLPENKPTPFRAVVVTGAWTTVKEQMPDTYAARLAQRGLAALTFDFRGWGESVAPEDEQQRYLEDPYRKIADTQAAFDAIKEMPELDENRVGGLGICASAGYMSQAVSKNDNVKFLALVAPWLHDSEIIAEAFGGQETINQLIEASRAAQQADHAVIIEAASTSNDHALMYQQPYYTEPDRGLILQYDNRFNVASWENWLTFDSVATAKQIDKPVFNCAFRKGRHPGWRPAVSKNPRA